MDNRRSVFINGAFLPADEAKISIFDRGFLMGDAVYEVSAVIDGHMIDNGDHLHRLARSLGELNMPLPMPLRDIVGIQEALIADNHLREGIVYIQVTRGTAERNFIFDPEMRQNIILFTREMTLVDNPLATRGARVMTVPDIRWQRRDIKTTQLLAQSLAKMIARDAGADDAWLVDNDGYITEGSSSNVWLLKGNRAFTRPVNHEILNGITRRTLISLLATQGLELCEQAFTPREALCADEAFTTSASGLITPVVALDEVAIGNGIPGVKTLSLRAAYLDHVRR